MKTNRIDNIIEALGRHEDPKSIQVLEEICPLSARIVVNQVSMKMESERIEKLLTDLKKVI